MGAHNHLTVDVSDETKADATEKVLEHYNKSLYKAYTNGWEDCATFYADEKPVPDPRVAADMWLRIQQLLDAIQDADKHDVPIEIRHLGKQIRAERDSLKKYGR